MVEPKFIKLEERATIPTRATAGSAGYDLTAMEGIVVPPGQSVIVSTGVAWEMHEAIYGKIFSRSGLAKEGISAEAGVIDSDYKGEINVLLRNHGNGHYIVNEGDRVAQIVLMPYIHFTGETFDKVRDGGYGSTGK